MHRKLTTQLTLATLVSAALAIGSWYTGWWDIKTQRVPRSTVDLRDGALKLKGSTSPFTGIMFEQAQGGQRISEVPVWRGKVHGIARGWHSNGQLEVEEPFINGLSNGLRTRWHPNGKIRSTTTIVKGVLNGPYTEWHDNGQKALEMTLLNGKGEGLSQAWQPDGTPKSKVTLKAGEPIKTE